MDNAISKWWKSKEIEELLSDLDLKMTDGSTAADSDFRIINFYEDYVIIKTGSTETKHRNVEDVSTLFAACEDHVAVLVNEEQKIPTQEQDLN